MIIKSFFIEHGYLFLLFYFSAIIFFIIIIGWLENAAYEWTSVF